MQVRAEAQHAHICELEQCMWSDQTTNLNVDKQDVTMGTLFLSKHSGYEDVSPIAMLLRPYQGSDCTGATKTSGS
jgi:hypothetical protein